MTDEPRFDFFDALDAYEERHFNALLGALLTREGVAERFLEEVGRLHRIVIPPHGPLYAEPESRELEDQWPDHMISDGSHCKVIVECKVLLVSFREEQIREQMRLGLEKLEQMDGGPDRSKRWMLYLYVAPDTLTVDLSRFHPPSPSVQGPQFVGSIFIPMSEVARLFSWLDELDSLCYSELRDYVAYLAKEGRLEAMESGIADHLEALAQFGLEKVSRNIIETAQQTKRIAESELEHVAALRRVSPAPGLADTYVSVDADWYPEWINYIYLDLALQTEGPTVYGIVQCKEKLDEKAKRDRGAFVEAMKKHFPELEPIGGTNFAGIPLTSRNFLREPGQAADEAGRKFAAFVKAAHDVCAATGP